MNRKQETIRVFAILALILVLAGCSSPTAVVAPTPDIPMVRTEAVQTVVAKITIEAALNPTATTAPTAEAPAVVTATQAPTATEAPATPTTAVAATATSTLRPVTSGGGGAVYPTATRRSGPDQASLVSQEPKDGTVFGPGTEFDGTWTFKNVGTSTWNSNFYYRETTQGTKLAKANRYYLSKSVKPNESITLVSDMVAPAQGGRYVSYWELVNDNGAVFYSFYLVIDVK